MQTYRLASQKMSASSADRIAAALRIAGTSSGVSVLSQTSSRRTFPTFIKICHPAESLLTRQRGPFMALCCLSVFGSFEGNISRTHVSFHDRQLLSDELS
jgi:hypothetical protein